jgi:threonine dehydrogenase-like Zn-dependent dehydrogenase
MPKPIVEAIARNGSRALWLAREATMQALLFRHSVPRQIITKLLSFASAEALLGKTAPMQLEEIPEPRLPADDWLVIRTRLCGICGSDSKQVFLNGSPDNPMTSLISFPQVLGHEVVGTVERVGPAVKQRRIGDRVVLNPWLSCAPRGFAVPCAACADGDYSICENFARGHIPPGIHTGNSSAATGGFAPYVPAHESMAIPIPDGVSDEAAVLADPFSVSLHAILKRPPVPGRHAVVYGCGTLGLCAIEILRRLYPESPVIAIARFPHQQQIARRLGAQEVVPHQPAAEVIERVARICRSDVLKPWFGKPMLNGGADVVYDTVGYPATIEIGVRITRPRGAIIVTGVEMPKRFEWTPLYFKEIHLIGSNAFGQEDFEGRRRHAMEIYLDLVRDGRIDVTPILTHRFTLAEYRDAFRACYDQHRSGAVKVLFAYPASPDGSFPPGASSSQGSSVPAGA